MAGIKVKLSELVKEITTVAGTKIKIVDMGHQCGEGDCLCMFGFMRKDDDAKKGLVTLDMCQHHRDITK